MSNDDNHPIAAAMEKVYGPLVALSGRLPAPLAYGLAILIALIVAFVISVPFRAAIPSNLLWLILAIDLASLLAFILVDWQSRQAAKERSSIRHILESTVLNVVVHAESDPTDPIANAEVTLALPEPVIKMTGPNGSATFAIPNSLVGQEFYLNARKAGFRSAQPTKVVLRRQGYEFLPLPKEGTAPIDAPFHQSSTTEPQPRQGEVAAHRLLYDSASEEEPFITWTLFSSAGALHKHISIIRRGSDDAPAFRLSAAGSEAVGVNKSFRVLRGHVEFEYKVEACRSEGPNMFFFMIPMQETGIGRSGLIEVGTTVEDDPRNAFSPYRARLVVPVKHCGDGNWHDGKVEFDFRETPETFYSIFGPRINEGSVHPGASVLLVTNIRLYSSEV